MTHQIIMHITTQQCTTALGKRKHALEEYYEHSQTADPSMGIFDGPTTKKKQRTNSDNNSLAECLVRESMDAISFAITTRCSRDDEPRRTILGKRKHATNNDSGVGDDDEQYHSDFDHQWERDDPRRRTGFKIRKTTEAGSLLIETEFYDGSTSPIQPTTMEEAQRYIRPVESSERPFVIHATPPRQTRWSEIYERILIKQLGKSK